MKRSTFGKSIALGLTVVVAATAAPGADAATKKKATTTKKKAPVTAAPTTQAPKVTTAAPTTAATPAGISLTGFDVGAKTIKIGLSGILTGPFGFLGTFQKNSLQVEIDRINAAGGVGGAKLELVVRDDGASPAKATEIAREFSNDPNVGLVVGPSLTGNFNAVRGIYEEAKKLNCQPAVSGDSGFGTSLKYAFRAQDAATDVVPLLLKYLKESDVGILGLIYTNNATGKENERLIPATADKINIVWAGSYLTQAADQSHTSYVKDVMDVFGKRPTLNPAIWIDNDQNAAKTVIAGKAAGFKGIYVGGSGLQSYQVVDAGGVGMDDATFESPYLGALSRIPLDKQPKAYARHTQEVIKQYGFEKGTREPVQQYKGTAIAADCVVMYANAVAKAKSTNSEAVLKAWESLSFTSDELPSGVPAKFSATDHETYEQADLWVWRWKKDAQGWFLELARKADSSK
jgi:branched-chain amino acid transport system substrate-binding protein